jgi:hypothetical protein
MITASAGNLVVLLSKANAHGAPRRRGSSAPPHTRPHPHPHGHSHGSHSNSFTGQENTGRRRRLIDFDMDKVRSTLKHLVRDWSEEVRVTSFIICVSTLMKLQSIDERQASCMTRITYVPLSCDVLQVTPTTYIPSVSLVDTYTFSRKADN